MSDLFIIVLGGIFSILVAVFWGMYVGAIIKDGKIKEEGDKYKKDAWEVKSIRDREGYPEFELDRLGEEGWELMACEIKDGITFAILKRKVEK